MRKSLRYFTFSFPDLSAGLFQQGTCPFGADGILCATAPALLEDRVPAGRGLHLSSSWNGSYGGNARAF